jgi:CheY-like chemotaxis protein
VKDGQEALDVLRGGGSIDLLFTDLVMPGGINGRQLADEARRLRPHLPVLFTSGYAAESIMRDDRLDAGVHLLGKPYRRAELAAKVREVLASTVSVRQGAC